MWTLIFYTHSHFHTSIFYQLINVNAPQPDAYKRFADDHPMNGNEFVENERDL